MAPRFSFSDKPKNFIFCMQFEKAEQVLDLIKDYACALIASYYTVHRTCYQVVAAVAVDGRVGYDGGDGALAGMCAGLMARGQNL